MVDEGSLVGALEILLDEDVELILVGGLACVIQGAPFVTQDVDVVHRRTEANVDRLKQSSTHPKDRRTVSALKALLAARDGETE